MARKIVKESLMTLLVCVAICVITYLAVVFVSTFGTPALVAVSLMFLAPFVCGTAISYYGKNQGRQLRVCIATLGVVDILSLMLYVNNTATTSVLSKFTGHYNLEATAVFLYYAMLSCTGLLFGMGAGYLIWKLKRK